MASVQCYKTCEESCQQNQHASLGKKVSDLFKGHHHQAQTQTHTQRSSQTKSSKDALSFTDQSFESQAHAIHGRTRRQHKNKNLVQKIKDGLSGHSSDSSSSESDNDDEKCRNRKN